MGSHHRSYPFFFCLFSFFLLFYFSFLYIRSNKSQFIAVDVLPAVVVTVYVSIYYVLNVSVSPGLPCGVVHRDEAKAEVP